LSDFLISLDDDCLGQDLLTLLKKPYGSRSPEGHFYEYPWGKVAVLEEHLADTKNIIETDNMILAWVGDLVTKFSDGFGDKLINRVLSLRAEPKKNKCLQSDEVFGRLNGAFVIVLADQTGFSIVTDLMSFIPVYVGTSANNNVVSLGTHPDLVAAISKNSFNLDMISVTEFLDSGCCTFPYTMYANVRELTPGKIHITEIDKNNKVVTAEHTYWTPPEEIQEEVDTESLVSQLEEALLSAVRSRCDAAKIGVLLSGGLDSRLILSAIPKELECVCVTYSNNPNRETRTASQVAKCYGRPWLALYRDSEFLANNIVETVSLIGCEFDEFEAHNGGFAKQITEQNVGSLLSGFLFDMYFKGLYAENWIISKRFFGMLAPVIRKSECYRFGGLSDFWSHNILTGVIEKLTTRREKLYADNLDCNRSSLAEWVALYPFSQDPIAYWVADRKSLPLRLVAVDRQLLDFAFRCPLKLKLGHAIFEKAAKKICSESLSIPSANNGVKLGSSNLSRLKQRAVRKTGDKIKRLLEKIGRESKVEHSWHDYQNYWQKSKGITKLIEEYVENLACFDETLFQGHGQALLKDRDIYWPYGFRLLQLAIWRKLIERYR